MPRIKDSSAAKAKAAELNALAEKGGHTFPTAQELGVRNKPTRKDKDGVQAPDCPCFSANIDGIDWTEYSPSEYVNVLMNNPCLNTTLKGVCSRHDCKMNVVKHLSADSWNSHLEKYKTTTNFPLITNSAESLRYSMAESLAEEIVSQTVGAKVKVAQAKEKTAMKFAGSVKASASAYKEAIDKAESHFDSITADEKATIMDMMSGGSSGSAKKGKMVIHNQSATLSLPTSNTEDIDALKAELARVKESEKQLESVLEHESQKKAEMALKLAETEHEALLNRKKLLDARAVANELSIDAGAMHEPYPGLESQPSVDYGALIDEEMDTKGGMDTWDNE